MKTRRRRQHNDFDFDCVHWWGDRHPDPDDGRNRYFGGSPALTDDRRCLVCRPYTEEEQRALLEPVLPPNPPCGGITTNGSWPPPCCEVHVLPWGHDRSDLGLLRGVVAPDHEESRG